MCVCVCVCVYLLGKAKSLQKTDWLWRGICAIPHPLVNKQLLRIATQAMREFLQYITDEVVGNFLVHRVADVSAWFLYFDRIGAKYTPPPRVSNEHCVQRTILFGPY